MVRALETALVVCYSRAFTSSSIVTLDRHDYEPSDQRLASLHHRILALRDSTFAHSDKDVDRQISIGRSAGVAETYGPVLTSEEFGLCPELFETQRVRLLDETIEVDERLKRARMVSPSVSPSDEKPAG